MTDDVPAALVSIIYRGLQVQRRDGQSYDDWREDRARNIAQAIIGLMSVEILDDEGTDPIRVVARRAGT